ncbi:MAG: protein kinase [Planctomycetota bacterium]
MPTLPANRNLFRYADQKYPMTNGSQASERRVTLGESRIIESVCSNFEDQWPLGNEQWRELLEGHEGRLRVSLYCEMVKLDVELRREHGEAPASEDYRPAELNVELDGYTDCFWTEVAGVEELALPSQRYVYRSRLGQGGIGIVYRVFDREQSRSVALKTLRPHFRDDPEAKNRFGLEAILTGRLQHPGIPPIYEMGSLDDEAPYFTMRIIEGQNLRDLLVGSSSESGDRVALLRVFENVAQIVAYAHQQGVLHRDIKPQNVMVGAFGEVQLVDWGLAKRISVNSEAKPNKGALPLEETQATDSLLEDTTLVGHFVGTPRHASPEQSRGDEMAANPTSDVFSLGTVLFEILTSRRLFDGDSTKEAVKKTKQGELAKMKSLLDECDAASELKDLCHRCLQADPARRPTDASAVAEAVRQYLATLQQQLTEAKIQRAEELLRSQASRQRTRMLAVVGAFCFVLVSATALFALRQWQVTRLAAASEREARVYAQSQSDSVNEINDFLTRFISAARPDAYGRNVNYRDVLIRGAADLDLGNIERPEVEAALRITLGETFRWLDDVEMAEKQLRVAIRLLEELKENDSYALLKARLSLAEVLWYHDRPEDPKEALRIVDSVQNDASEQFGPTSPLSLSAKTLRAQVLTHLERDEAASAECEEVLRLCDSGDAPISFDCDRTRVVLAQVRKDQDRWDEAEELLETVLGNEDGLPSIRLPAMMQLGELYHWHEKFDRSIETFRIALSEHEALLGETHRMTLSTMRKLFRVFLDAGRYQELLTMADDSIARHEIWDGVAETSVLEARSKKARALFGIGRAVEAEGVLRESVDISSETHGVDSQYMDETTAELKAFLAGHEVYLAYEPDFDW